MIEKILLADSGMGHSKEMLQALMGLPAIQKATVTVLHVVPSQVSAEGMQTKLQEGAKTLAAAVESLYADTHQVASVNTILREGEPKDEVCRVAEEIDADLIIMGSRGLKRLRSILQNSVSQYVFQLTPRPMLLVKDDIYVKNIKRVMVALNDSEPARQCLKLAMFLLQGVKGGQLILVHVNPGSKESGDTTTINAEKDPVLAPAVLEAKKRGITSKCVVSSGKPSEEICRLAEESDVDLLILGSPERRPSIAKSLPDIDRLLGASVSDYVRIQATCPVLLARTVEA